MFNSIAQQIMLISAAKDHPYPETSTVFSLVVTPRIRFTVSVHRILIFISEFIPVFLSAELVAISINTTRKHNRKKRHELNHTHHTDLIHESSDVSDRASDTRSRSIASRSVSPNILF